MIEAPGRSAQPFASIGRRPSWNQGMSGSFAWTSFHAILVGSFGAALAGSAPGASALGGGAEGRGGGAGASGGTKGSAFETMMSGLAAAVPDENRPSSQPSK